MSNMKLSHIKIKLLLLILILCCSTDIVFPKNLTILSKSFLNNNELLDIFLHEDYAFIPGGLGGLNIVDVSDPYNVQVLGTYESNNCRWGRLYSWTVLGNYAYGAGRECGIEIIDISDITNPKFVDNISTNGVRYEHVEAQDGYLYAARHYSGVEIFSISNPQSINSINRINTENAWAVLPIRDFLYIADGASGIKIFNIDNPNNPVHISSLKTSGSARDISISGNNLFVAVGSYGVDMINIEDPANPELLSNYNTTGFASRISSGDSLVVVSDWDDVEVLEFVSGKLNLKGFKNTGGRTMAVAMKNNIIFSAEWTAFYVYQFGNIYAPDIDFSSRKIDFPRTISGQTSKETFYVTNNGFEKLDIFNIDFLNSDFKVELPSQHIDPGETVEAIVEYSPNSSNWKKSVIFNSNDNDKSMSSVLMRGNFPYGPMPGDNAPGFSLFPVSKDPDPGKVNLESLKGSPTVIAFFTAW